MNMQKLCYVLDQTFTFVSQGQHFHDSFRESNLFQVYQNKLNFNRMGAIWHKFAQNLDQLLEIVFQLWRFPLASQNSDETQSILLGQVFEHGVQIGHIFQQFLQIDILNTLLLILAHVN